MAQKVQEKELLPAGYMLFNQRLARPVPITTTLQENSMSSQKSVFSRLLPVLTIACLATCAVAGLAIGLYDIAYTSVNLDIPQKAELLVLR